jgi:hypothetical protein
LERFSRPDDISAAKAIAAGLVVKFHVPDIQLSRTRIPRMTESSFNFSSACKPFLLENRIAVLRVAAQVLCLMEGTEPIDLRRTRTLADLLSSSRLGQAGSRSHLFTASSTSSRNKGILCFAL